MVKINVFIDDLIFKEYHKLPGTFSEHVRRAMTEYLNRYQNVTTSNSVVSYTVKGGEDAKSDS